MEGAGRWSERDLHPPGTRFDGLPRHYVRPVIPTAPNIDSLRDSQIRESLTRCWLLKEEQHRWVQRLRSDGLI